jgi:hypothetical protein
VQTEEGGGQQLGVARSHRFASWRKASNRASSPRGSWQLAPGPPHLAAVSSVAGDVLPAMRERLPRAHSTSTGGPSLACPPG